MIDFIDLNNRVQIAFGLMLIVFLLTYIAFFKDAALKGRNEKRQS